MSSYDCIVIGSGHAGSCAALSAVESGCKRVLMVDKCPPDWVGGNGYFTPGTHRTVHGGLEDLLPIVRDVPNEIADSIDIKPYTREEFSQDIIRPGSGKSDSALVDAVVDNSRDAIDWLASAAGVPFVFSFDPQEHKNGEKQQLGGATVLGVYDGGKGLIAAHQRALADAGVEIWFNAPAVELLIDSDGNGAISGVVVKKDGVAMKLSSRAVVLAAGGFEANSHLRSRYLGGNWAKAKIRGTKYNTGDGFAMARTAGAKFTGDWEGCHSTVWGADAPQNDGSRERMQFTKLGYTLGITVNAKGERFVDEGEDIRIKTYTKFGRAIITQPGGFAFQVWDAKVVSALKREEYGDGVVDRISADTREELAEKLVGKGLEDKERFLATLASFNEAIRNHRSENPRVTWDPAIKDGLSTQSAQSSLAIPKSNWALPVDEAPFMAVKVTAGITFTFGGLAIDPATAGVLSEATGRPIKGLFCTGEMVGGLFYASHPSGSGLTAGAVFGRKAGREAAKLLDSSSTM